MPSAPSRQACSNTVGPSSATCSLSGIPPRCRGAVAPARPCDRETGDCADPQRRASVTLTKKLTRELVMRRPGVTREPVKGRPGTRTCPTDLSVACPKYGKSFWGRGPMMDAWSRVAHYRALAEECRRLAATSLSVQMRSRYWWMAEHYSTLTEAEGRWHTILRRLAASIAPATVRPKKTLGPPPIPVGAASGFALSKSRCNPRDLGGVRIRLRAPSGRCR